jgi:hypothetical protein
MPGEYKEALEVDEALFSTLQNLTKSKELALVVLFEKDGTATGYAYPVAKCSPFSGNLKDVTLVEFQAAIARTTASPDTCWFCWWENGVKKCRQYPC